MSDRSSKRHRKELVRELRRSRRGPPSRRRIAAYFSAVLSISGALALVAVHSGIPATDAAVAVGLVFLLFGRRLPELFAVTPPVKVGFPGEADA
jgi:hypothetical protein